MVVEREPPKANPQAQAKQPEFGQPAALVSPLRSTNVFNIPKTNHPRPEHHRPAATIQETPAASSLPQPPLFNIAEAGLQPQFSVNSDASSYGRNAFVNPFAPLPRPSLQPKQHADNDAYMVPRPINPPTWPTYPVKPALFSSLPASGGFATVNPPQQRVDVDLTTMNYGDNFGDPSVSEYVDQAKATEDIKALLEGAFEDEDDKPKTRSRRKKLSVKGAELADKLKSLDVAPTADEEEEEEEEEEEDDGTVEGLKVKLLPHQVNGVDWMREKELGTRKIKGALPKGGILADDMGLGKTIQSLSLILTNPRPPLHSFTGGKEDKGKLSNSVGKGTLVVAPLALIKQWEAEISSKVDDDHKLRVCVHHGPQRTKRFEDLRKYDVVITTYQILVSEHGNSSERPDGPQVGCFGLHWYRVILDEAHSIKNRNAKATQACYALRSEFRWCLTGTPMQNNLDELQSLIKFLRIKPYNELSVWKDQIMRPLLAGRGGIAMRRLQYYLKAFMKRRTKNILKEEGALNPGGKPTSGDPSKATFKITERRIVKLEAEFTPQERRFYERLEQRTDKSIEQMMDSAKMSYASALTLLLRLRQACNHSHLVTKVDKEALETERADKQAFRNHASSGNDIDDIAEALGGLSVATKQCDVCQIRLSSTEISAGMGRCTECQADLDEMAPTKKVKKSKKEKKSKEKAIKVKTEAQRKRNRNRAIVQDSDDEDDEAGEGDWVVPKSQRQKSKLGKAGGSEDENVEGGGEWIGSDDSQTGDEASVQILGSHKKKVISLNTSDEDTSSSSSEPEESEDSEGDGDDSEEEDEEEEDSADDSDGSSPILVTESVKGKMVSTKIRKLLEILGREAGEHKFIVFSAFTSMLDVIEPFLRRDGFKYTRYDGSMRNDAREASLERLRNDKSTRVLLCSLKCGSLGLNLTAASRVVILEPFWNPFVEEQAIDRVHRLNQTVDVTVYKITIAQTVEERILELQEKKRALAEAAIEGKAIAKLSMQDILNLFKHDAETHGHHDAEHAGLGRAPKVLHADGKASARPGAPGEERRAAKAVATSSGRPAENSVYGRRW